MNPRTSVAALAALLASCACSSTGDTPEGGCAQPHAGRVYASVTDLEYAAGTVCSVDGASACGDACDAFGGAISSDMTFSTHGAMLVGLNGAHTTDNVTLFDVGADGTLALHAQVSVRQLAGETDADSDPRGYARVGDRGYVARFLRTRLAVVDTTSTPPAVTPGPDLADLAEGAAILGPSRALVVGDRVWISLVRVDNGLETFSHPGAIALIDPVANAVADADPTRDGAQPIELLRSNPVSPLVPAACENGTGSCVWVACVGSYYDDADGALEVVDTAPPYAAHDAITEAQLGGNVDAVAPLGPGRMLVRVVAREAQGSRAIEWSRLLAVDFTVTPPAVSAPWLQVHEWTLTEPIVGRDGRVYVGDRGEITDPARKRGIRVFDGASGAELTAAPIPVGTPGMIDAPYALVEDPTAR